MGSDPKPVPEDVLEDVERLHRAVDQMVRPLEERHGDALACHRGCLGCCVDDLRVFAVEAAVIRRRHEALLETGRPHGTGRCAFLDQEGGCRIYANRPYVCRTQGLPLRWGDEDADGNPMELRDICELNEAVGPLEQLQPEACWTLGAVEQKLEELQSRADNSRDTSEQRVTLRALFEEP